MQWTRRSIRRLKRLFFRSGRKAGLAYYVRLTHKLATRLGHARSRARQAERDRDWWRTQRETQLKSLMSEVLYLREANVDLQHLVKDYEASLKATADQRAHWREKARSMPPGVAL